VASILIPVAQRTSASVQELTVPNYEARGVFEAQSTADDGTADYDEASLGCEAMIGELNINYCRPTYEANSVKTARL
jgi:hypothetical protein